MENLLPPFTAISADEPASTQSLAQFDVTLSRLDLSAPPKVPAKASTGAGVVKDLLDWSDAARLELDDNRLVSAIPVVFERRPVLHDSLKGAKPPYEGEEASPPVNKSNRGSPLKATSARVFKELKPESPRGDGVYATSANLCFIHGAEQEPQQEEEPETAATITRDPDRFYGAYDMFLKSGSSSIEHNEVAKGSRFNFATNGKKKQSNDDMKAGVTFSLIKVSHLRGLAKL